MEEIVVSLNNYPALMADITTRAERAKVGTSVQTSPDFKIKSDEQDAEIVNLIAKVKKTHDHIEKSRKTFTKVLDDVKKDMMNPEKTTGEILNTLKSKRDAFANEKLAEQKKREEEIKKEQARQTAIVVFIEELKAAAKNGVLNLCTQTERYLSSMHSQCKTIEDCKTAVKKINITPVFKDTSYDKIFQIPTPAILSQDDIDNCISQVKAVYTFEAVSKQYISETEAIIQKWVSLFNDLAEIIKTKGEEAAQEEQQEASQKAKQEAEEKAKAIQESADKAKQEAELRAAMEAQVSIQETKSKKAKGTSVVRKIKITKMTAYADLLAWFIVQGGSINKLDFLISFAEENPPSKEINGIEWYEEAKTSARK